ncbi:uncharacterized protein LOC126886262 [Diabrotica virgifera virgifera]|uniref:Uncharacterized protein n=1 Tax=Diabrotica virgifera virgifera TaxID=50390 RepID=A0ABM5KG06_DIAVI|nr:uncharacterized protein LOC126886262 [Diabrotica virgifera virgifera]
MEKLKFQFTIQGSADGKTNEICITAIETPDGRVFELPEEFKQVNKHTYLAKSNVFMKVKNSLKKRGQKRNLWVPLDIEMRKIYLDDGENLQFGEQYLDEKTQSVVATYEKEIPSIKNLSRVTESFLIEKFSIKIPNACQWMEDFERECERFEIIDDEQKIESLKYLLEKQCLDWYSSMIIKYTVQSDWKIWKTNFCDAYEKKGWSQIKYAFTFKYQSGSLIEYATKKERLLLEVNKTIDNNTLINLIVLGLPDDIMNKLDKYSLISTTHLFSELNKNEYLVNKQGKRQKVFLDFKEKVEEKQYKTSQRLYKEQKHVCSICEKLKKGTRYHLESACWYKAKDNHNDKDSQIQLINNSEIECELQNENQKNC